MIDLEKYLYDKVKNEIDKWDEEGIYAISFFIYSNEAYEYQNYSNVTDFSISYNTEEDCNKAKPYSEERWNYAFWRQDEVPIIDTYNKNEGAEILFKWYKENGIENIGYVDEDCYDDNCRYIGKGPVGYYELLTVLAEVAKKLQTEGYIKEKFNKPIPIILHDLEYSWYCIEATKKANHSGEANDFLKAMG